MRTGRDPLAARTVDDARRTAARRLVALVVALAAVIVAGSAALHHGPASTPSGGSGAAQTAPPAPTTPAGPGSAATPAGPGTAISSTSPSARPARALSGRALAEAWLTGYLDRSRRDDERWVEAIRDITDPDLLAQLQSNGPDAVGLFQLSSWRVSGLTRFDDPDQPLDTPSRQVLTYSVAVTDGQQTEHKPFLLYCYRSADARWTVSMVEQPYTSEN